jgi:hypothetical protein
MKRISLDDEQYSDGDHKSVKHDNKDQNPTQNNTRQYYQNENNKRLPHTSNQTKSIESTQNINLLEYKISQVLIFVFFFLELIKNNNNSI